MTDIQIAKANLNGHSICLCKDGEFFVDDGRGLSPMMKLIAEGRDLRGYSVADVIVGKAAAIMFVRARIAEVYGEVMSSDGWDYLKQHNISCSCGALTEKIINSKGDDICPMEKIVADISDAYHGYEVLNKRLLTLQKQGIQSNPITDKTF